MSTASAGHPLLSAVPLAIPRSQILAIARCALRCVLVQGTRQTASVYKWCFGQGRSTPLHPFVSVSCQPLKHLPSSVRKQRGAPGRPISFGGRNPPQFFRNIICQARHPWSLTTSPRAVQKARTGSLAHGVCLAFPNPVSSHASRSRPVTTCPPNTVRVPHAHASNRSRHPHLMPPTSTFIHTCM